MKTGGRDLTPTSVTTVENSGMTFSGVFDVLFFFEGKHSIGMHVVALFGPIVWKVCFVCRSKWPRPQRLPKMSDISHGMAVFTFYKITPRSCHAVVENSSSWQVPMRCLYSAVKNKK